VERFHLTLRRNLLNDHQPTCRWVAQATVDGFVAQHNIDRPHQAPDERTRVTPADRFRRRAGQDRKVTVAVTVSATATAGATVAGLSGTYTIPVWSRDPARRAQLSTTFTRASRAEPVACNRGRVVHVRSNQEPILWYETARRGGGGPRGSANMPAAAGKDVPAMSRWVGAGVAVAMRSVATMERSDDGA
jgi:hypothetical protein